MQLRSTDALLIITLSFAAISLSCRSTERAPNTDTVSFSLQTISTTDTLDHVRDIRVMSDGKLLVLSSSPPFFVLIDSLGNVETARGRRGRGPTDLLYPFFFASDAHNDSSLNVIDLGRKQLLRLNNAMTPDSAIDIKLVFGNMRADMPSLVAVLPVALVKLGDHWLGVRIPNDISNETDFQSQEVFTLSGSTDTVLRKIRKEASYNRRWLLRNELWSACGTQGLAGVNRNHQFLIRIDSAHHIDSVKLQLPIERLPLTRGDIQTNLRYHLAGELRESGVSPSDHILDSLSAMSAKESSISDSDSLPVFASVLCSDNGALWLQSFDMKESPVGSGRIWWREASAGWQRMEMPESFRPVRIVANRVYGVYTNNDGAEHIAVAMPQK